MSYDSKCFDLAEHFLSDEAQGLSVEDLAQHIQDAVENWIQYELSEQLRRTDGGVK